MTDPTRRRTERVGCDVPLNLVGRLDGASVKLVDMSRDGLRLRVALADLDLHPHAGLLAVWARASKALLDATLVDFDPNVLGDLVRRRIRPVRLTHSPDDPSCVEVGCSFEVPLGEEDLAALGLDLPT